MITIGYIPEKKIKEKEVKETKETKDNKKK